MWRDLQTRGWNREGARAGPVKGPCTDQMAESALVRPNAATTNPHDGSVIHLLEADSLPDSMHCVTFLAAFRSLHGICSATVASRRRSLTRWRLDLRINVLAIRRAVGFRSAGVPAVIQPVYPDPPRYIMVQHSTAFRRANIPDAASCLAAGSCASQESPARGFASSNTTFVPTQSAAASLPRRFPMPAFPCTLEPVKRGVVITAGSSINMSLAAHLPLILFDTVVYVFLCRSGELLPLCWSVGFMQASQPPRGQKCFMTPP